MLQYKYTKTYQTSVIQEKIEKFDVKSQISFTILEVISNDTISYKYLLKVHLFHTLGGIYKTTRKVAVDPDFS